MKNFLILFLSFTVFFTACDVKNNKQLADNQTSIDTITKIDTLKKSSVIIEDTTTFSPDFMEKMPSINADKWNEKRKFVGEFSVDSAMQNIFGTHFYHLPMDNYGNESDTEILPVAVWKIGSYTQKIFKNNWLGEYDTFPSKTNNIHTTNVIYDTLIIVNNIKFAVITTSTLATQYLPEFTHTGRFAGAFLGIALFEQKNEAWELQFYNPAIGYYGSFSVAPTPKIYEIGQNKLGVIVEYANGGAGGPFYSDLYIHTVNKESPLIFEEHFMDRIHDEKSSWATIVSFENVGKQDFADIILTTKGHFLKQSFVEDGEELNLEDSNLPKSLQEKIKKQDDFDFVLKRTYQYGKGGYKMNKEEME